MDHLHKVIQFYRLGIVGGIWQNEHDDDNSTSENENESQELTLRQRATMNVLRRPDVAEFVQERMTQMAPQIEEARKALLAEERQRLREDARLRVLVNALSREIMAGENIREMREAQQAEIEGQMAELASHGMDAVQMQKTREGLEQDLRDGIKTSARYLAEVSLDGDPDKQVQTEQRIGNYQEQEDAEVRFLLCKEMDIPDFDKANTELLKQIQRQVERSVRQNDVEPEVLEREDVAELVDAREEQLKQSPIERGAQIERAKEAFERNPPAGQSLIRPDGTSVKPGDSPEALRKYRDGKYEKQQKLEAKMLDLKLAEYQGTSIPDPDVRASRGKQKKDDSKVF